MDPTSNTSDADRTQVIRKRADGTSPPRPSSGIRVWPPRPSPSAVTVAELNLDADSVQDQPKQPFERVVEGILVEHLCQKCDCKLIDPDGVGVCPQCGWCRSLVEGTESLVEAEQLGDEEDAPSVIGRPRFRMPYWSWGLLGGALLIIGTAIIVSLSFPGQSRERTIWSTVQLIIGLCTMMAAQWWLIFRIQPDDHHIGPMDLFVISGKLWSRAFRQMPTTLGPVFLCCWGLLIAITAVTITGGLADWFIARSK